MGSYMGLWPRRLLEICLSHRYFENCFMLMLACQGLLQRSRALVQFEA